MNGRVCSDASSSLNEVLELLRSDGLDEQAACWLGALYRRYAAGEKGKIPWSEIEQPERGDILQLDASSGAEPAPQRARELLKSLVVVSLNGGLGTTMRLERAKSLIRVRDGSSFLEIKARQLLALRQRHGVAVPLLLMNSWHTSEDSLAVLGRLGLATPGLPLDFLQHRFPRLELHSGRPARLDGQQAWSPPGHGDIYLALWRSGVLELLLERGARWAFVSNIDNLGATVDLRILSLLEQEGVDFAMEVTSKTAADIKGGTLVRRRGRLTLLEAAQVEPECLHLFQDTGVFPVFNSNNLWLRLDRLLEMLREGTLELPLIVNPKRVGGSDVVQLETAMGAAVGCFARARGLLVPRSRFAPVKDTADLLAVRSNAYVLDEEVGLRPNPARPAAWGPPVIRLDPRYYAALDDLEARFAEPPSLLRCRSLRVGGDVRFGQRVSIEGEVAVEAPDGGPCFIEDGAVLSGPAPLAGPPSA